MQVAGQDPVAQRRGELVDLTVVGDLQVGGPGAHLELGDGRPFRVVLGGLAAEKRAQDGPHEPPTRAAMELPEAPFSHQRFRLETTSSALKASPLFQVMPLRRCSVYSVASSLTSQLSSRTGSKVN